jgi:hypothetical protein
MFALSHGEHNPGRMDAALRTPISRTGGGKTNNYPDAKVKRTAKIVSDV